MAVRVGAVPIVVAAVLVGLLVVTLPQKSPPAGGCVAPAATVLPGWARSGFRDPEPVVPHVVGDGGEIVAITFDDLTQPPSGHDDKILWVARDGSAEPLTLTARLGDAVVEQTLPDGPGPSTVDVPAPGCWTFDLRWGAHHDTLVLRYAPG